jgi:hypothetical protein
MMRRKLIYISCVRLTDNLSKDRYIDYSIRKGAVVEFWDVVSLVREEHEERGAIDPPYLRYIKNPHELEGLICQPENREAVYIILVPYTAGFCKPFLLLSKYKCRTVIFNEGGMPYDSRINKWRRIIYKLVLNPVSFFERVLGELETILYRKFNIVKRFDLAFLAGTALTKIDLYAKKIVPFNYFDFEHFKDVQLLNQGSIKGRYAVFLDQNLPYHSDFAISGRVLLNPTNYYQSLNRFFYLMERAHGIKVVIAAHPKCNYGNEKFEGRETYRRKTAELVKNAEFVMLHYSTALSYAILNFKPILFIYTEEMEALYKNTILAEMESIVLYLKLPIYNIDKITDSDYISVKPQNHERYEAFKYNYLTSRDTEGLVSAEIFWNEISKL